VTSAEFRSRLAVHASRAGVSISPEVEGQLEAYFRLLAKWNKKINLTALPVDSPGAETFDRLFVEPLAAARYVPDSVKAWWDVGSGGGSPAIPLKIARPSAQLTLIESKSRKVAFLREAVQALGLSETVVQNDRFESVATEATVRTVDLVTARAVRPARGLLEAIHRVLSSGGLTFFFHSPNQIFPDLNEFALVRTATLGTSANAKLSILRPVFHVEQNG
jgi:16S rRNA (guanine527-N7)-methyltransferase